MTFTLWETRGKPSVPAGTSIDELAVYLITSEAADAGTDRSVWFDVGPLGWRLWSPHNDFERGLQRLYPLSLPGNVPLTVGDITRLRLEKKGMFGYRGMPDGPSGEWVPRSVTLMVNGSPYMTRNIGKPLSQSARNGWSR